MFTRECSTLNHALGYSTRTGTCVLHGKIILNRVGLWSVPVLHERGTSV